MLPRWSTTAGDLMLPERRMFEDEACPVPEKVLGEMYRANPHGLNELIVSVPADGAGHAGDVLLPARASRFDRFGDRRDLRRGRPHAPRAAMPVRCCLQNLARPNPGRASPRIRSGAARSRWRAARCATWSRSTTKKSDAARLIARVRAVVRAGPRQPGIYHPCWPPCRAPFPPRLGRVMMAAE